MSALRSEEVEGALVLGFVSEKLLDEYVIQQVGKELMAIASNAENNRRIILSFRGVSFMSSAMIGRLVQFWKMCKQQGVLLKMSSISPVIMEVFKLTKLDKMFDIEKDERRALLSFDKKRWFS